MGASTASACNGKARCKSRVSVMPDRELLRSCTSLGGARCGDPIARSARRGWPGASGRPECRCQNTRKPSWSSTQEKPMASYRGRYRVRLPSAKTLCDADGRSALQKIRTEAPSRRDTQVILGRPVGLNLLRSRSPRRELTGEQCLWRAHLGRQVYRNVWQTVNSMPGAATTLGKQSKGYLCLRQCGLVYPTEYTLCNHGGHTPKST